MLGSVNHAAVSATTIRAGQRQRACSSRARTRSFMTRRISRQSAVKMSNASATTIAAMSTRPRPVSRIPSMCPVYGTVTASSTRMARCGAPEPERAGGTALSWELAALAGE